MKPVLVTTKHRGVFFGYLEEEHHNAPKELTLSNARNCIYWDSQTKGFLGLCSAGPVGHSRVGPKVLSITLYDITSVSPVEDAAVKVWESGPWP